MIIRRIVTSPDSFQQRTFLKGYGCQFGTTLECCRFNSFYTCRNLNGGQGRTIRESTIIIRVSAKMRRRRITSPDSFQLRTFLKGYGCQFGTTLECRCSNRFYTGRNLNRSQCSTIRESAIIRRTTTDSFQLRTFFKGYSCQRGTAPKHSSSNCFYVGRNIYRNQRCTLFKCRITDSCCICRDYNGFQLTLIKHFFPNRY